MRGAETGGSAKRSGVILIVRKELDDVGFAQFVEFNPRLSFVVAPNTYLTVAGQLLYVNGISDANRYYAGLQSVADRRVHDDRDALFFGGSVGLTFKFDGIK